jgi:hypothetical protein
MNGPPFTRPQHLDKDGTDLNDSYSTAQCPVSRSGSFHQQAKKLRKILISIVL